MPLQSWYDEVMHRVKTADEIMISTLKGMIALGPDRDGSKQDMMVFIDLYFT